MKLIYLRTAAEHHLDSVACRRPLPEKQQHGSFLQSFLLLTALLLAGVGVSWGQKLPTASVTLSGGAGTPFALVNTSEGKAIYGSGNQDLAYNVYSEAFTDARTGYCFVLEKPTNGTYTYGDNDYLLKFLTKYNQEYTYGGNTSCYLNSTSWGLAFVLGLTGNNNYTYGQDMDNGAVWTITDNGNGTYKLQNKATGKYLAGNNSNDTGDNWSFCTVGDGCQVQFSANDGSMGSVTATVNGTSINSGDYVAYGTQVVLTANPNSGYVFKSWSNRETTPTRTWTVTQSGHPTATFEAGYTVTFGPNNVGWGTVTAKRLDTNANINSGDVVPSGTQVQFIATAATNYLTWQWQGDNTGYNANTTIEINENTNITHKFTRGYKISAVSTDGKYGSVVAVGGGKTGNDIHVTPYPYQDVIFKATPKSGCSLVGWYYDSNCTQPVSTTTNVTVDGNNVTFKDAYFPGVDDDTSKSNAFTLWAKFQDDTKYVTANLYCNHYVDGEGNKHNGSNNLGAHTLNASSNVESSSYDGTNYKFTVTTGAAGGYAYYKFNNKKNFSDLKGWNIGVDVPANVSNIAFYKNGSKVSDYWQNPTSRDNLTVDQKSALKEIDEIRINLKENTTTIFSSAFFNFEHAGRTTPTLNNGTEADMSIYETTSLTLSNTPGFWRQYTDGNYNTIKTTAGGSLIPDGGEWKSEYKLDNMQQGDYYFAARDGGNCALGYYHQTELVTVHVNVKALDLTGTKSTADGTFNEETGGFGNLSWNIDVNTEPQTQATVTMNNIAWNYRDGENTPTGSVYNTKCGGVILYRDKKNASLANNPEIRVTPPNGYRVQKVTFYFGENSYYDVSFNNGASVPKGTANSVTWVNSSTDKDYVRMVIRGEADQTSDDQKCTELHITSVQAWLVPVNAKVIDESRDITVNGQERKYWLYVPENVKNGKNKNVPVVFALHGGGEDYEPTHSGQLNFNSLADANNFIVVYPRAGEHFFYHFNDAKARAWLATGAQNEDTELFLAIIDALKAETEDFSINEKKIYMAGFSVGGMMTYATANLLADKFAAFASISGLPMNEVHHRTHGARPVPFLHVHGTKDNFVNYSLMPTIVDNMLVRNGLSYTPTATVEGDADIWSDTGKTRYKKYAYGDEADKTAAPYIYYQIGTGITASDTGMGHNHWCNIGGKDVKQVMWEFFSGRSLPSPIANPFEFKADINTANNNARDHGWQTNTSTGILAQYGESGGYTNKNQNVYHSIQLNPGTHYISFKAAGNNDDHYVRVRVAKLADITPFNSITEQKGVEKTVDINEKVIVDNAAYKISGGEISIKFDTDDPTGEYIISITKGGQYDNTTISDIMISNNGTEKGEKYTGAISTDFTGYFNYNNRLFAQWNFDLSDGYRANALKLAANSGTWEADYSSTNTGNSSASFGTIIFKNVNNIGTPGATATELGSYGELTYNGTEPIAIAAGLKFMAESGKVKIHIDLANGQVSGAHLELAQGVKMHIPYVENSYRNDTNDGTVIDSQKSKEDQLELFGKYENCLHHINRDIVYIALQEGNAWDHITNKCLDAGHTDQELFRNGGDEYVNGRTYNKADYMGIQGTPCFVEFKKATTIDRIGVNRNLIYSFYTEYINELGMAKPNTRYRVVGSPTGAKVANIGEWTTYEGAIAMTYGGWMNSEGGSSYTKIDNTQTTDAWSDLGVINYNPDNNVTDGSAIHFNTWTSMKPSQVGTNSLPAIDGFPVVALLDTEARSGSLLPSNLAPKVAKTENGVDYVAATGKDDNDQDVTVYIPNYTPQCEGKYMVPTSSAPYEPNITPWSLPSRGGYAKFEPSIPGVLNMNVVQQGGHDYYIADEFGKLVDQNTIFSVTGMKQTIDKSNGCYRIANTDYVKHSLNVEPGKTYYIFSNTTGLGIAGFYFEPYVNHDGTERGRINIGVKSIKLKAGEAYSLPSEVNATETITSPTADGTKDYTINYSKKAVEVDLRRAFKANQWETICLPYSMNQVQMEQVFGEGTRVVLLRDIQDKPHSVDNKVTLTLICHENQDIIAGYPYLIRPTKAAPNGVKTIASLPDTAPEKVTVSSVGLNTNSYPVNSGGGKTYKYYGGIDQYTFKGQYGGSATVRNGSYVVKDGKLCKVKLDNTNETTISGYRAWIELNESVTEPKLAKAVTCFNGINGEIDDDDDFTTDIDKLLEQQGIFTNQTTVYGINGQVVRENAGNLNDLPKGIYIVNGKKYIVK